MTLATHTYEPTWESLDSRLVGAHRDAVSWSPHGDGTRIEAPALRVDEAPYRAAYVFRLTNTC